MRPPQLPQAGLIGREDDLDERQRIKALKRWLATTPSGRPRWMRDRERKPNRRSRAMKMNSAQIEQTLQQLQAQAIPAGHSVMPQLERLFGDHTYFLDGNGLNIVEPVDAEQDGGVRAVVVNLASWADKNEGNLEPHTPEVTERVIVLKPELRH
jgi:hypothetical protein